MYDQVKVLMGRLNLHLEEIPPESEQTVSNWVAKRDDLMQELCKELETFWKNDWD